MKRVKLKKERKQPTVSEVDSWRWKMANKFKGCRMLGRRECQFYQGYLYYFDVGSKCALVGVLHPDGATMVVSENSSNYERGVFRISLDKSKIRNNSGITRVKLNGKVKKGNNKAQESITKKEVKKERIQPKMDRKNRRMDKEIYQAKPLEGKKVFYKTRAITGS